MFAVLPLPDLSLAIFHFSTTKNCKLPITDEIDFNLYNV